MVGSDLFFFPPISESRVRTRLLRYVTESPRAHTAGRTVQESDQTPHGGASESRPGDQSGAPQRLEPTGGHYSCPGGRGGRFRKTPEVPINSKPALALSGTALTSHAGSDVWSEVLSRPTILILPVSRHKMHHGPEPASRTHRQVAHTFVPLARLSRKRGCGQ